MYLARSDVTAMNIQVAAKLARIFFAKQRHDRHQTSGSFTNPDVNRFSFGSAASTGHMPLAAELPAEDVIPGVHTIAGPRPYVHTGPTADAKYIVIPDDVKPRPVDSPHVMNPPSLLQHPAYNSGYDRLSSSHDSGHHRISSQQDSPISPTMHHHLPYGSSPHQQFGPPDTPPPRHSPPPLPPKTPLPQHNTPPHSDVSIQSRSHALPGMATSHPAGVPSQLPYPDIDGPPPIVNISRKPEGVYR